MKNISHILATVLFPAYCAAYAVAQLFNVPDKEDMPTPKEWFLEE